MNTSKNSSDSKPAALAGKLLAGALAIGLLGAGIYFAASGSRNKPEPLPTEAAAPILSVAESTAPAIPEDTQPPEQTEAPAPSADTETVPDWTVAYETVLRDYRGLWTVTWDNPALIGKEREYYPNARGSDMTLNHSTEQLLYARKDLDGNGIPELFIGVDYAGTGEVSLYDVFAANGTVPCHLVPDDYAFSFAVLSDGTIVEAQSWFGDIEHICRIAPDGFTTEEIPGDPLVGSNLFEDSTDFSAHGGKLSGLEWQPLEESLSGQADPDFDAIREDLWEACRVADYNANAAYYDERYSHLGPGVMWMLGNRDIPAEQGTGATTYNVFCTDFDIDADGEKELCVARGVTVQRGQVIVIYDRTADGIVPIYGDAVFSYLEPYEFGVLPVSPAEWDYLT